MPMTLREMSDKLAESYTALERDPKRLHITLALANTAGKFRNLVAEHLHACELSKCSPRGGDFEQLLGLPAPEGTRRTGRTR